MTAKLDLVLINPGSRTQVYQSLGKTLTAIENPVWAGLMASFCRVKGLSVEIIDGEAEELTAEQVAEHVEHLDPVLAVVVVYGHQPSASTQIMTACGMVCTAIKQRSPQQKVLCVGGHVAALPERTLAEEQTDFVAAGEGLHTMVQLVKALQDAGAELCRCAGSLLPRRRSLPQHAGHAAGHQSQRLHARRRLGPAADGPLSGAQLAVPRRPQPAALRGPIHDARLSVSLHVLPRQRTTIVTAQGRNKKIQHVHVGDQLMAWDEKEGKLSHTTVVATGSREVADLLRIETSDGFDILITDEHPVYTRRGWIEAGQLTTDDEIWAMEPRDKTSYIRRTFNNARRLEVRAKIAASKRARTTR